VGTVFTSISYAAFLLPRWNDWELAFVFKSVFPLRTLNELSELFTNQARDASKARVQKDSASLPRTSARHGKLAISAEASAIGPVLAATCFAHQIIRENQLGMVLNFVIGVSKP
jgi:hypothetical protein